MPDGFQKDLEFENQLEESFKDKTYQEVGIFLAREIVNLRKDINHQCHERQQDCENKFNNIKISRKQWIVFVLVAVLGCGGGETLFDFLVKVL